MTAMLEALPLPTSQIVHCDNESLTLRCRADDIHEFYGKYHELPLTVEYAGRQYYRASFNSLCEVVIYKRNRRSYERNDQESVLPA